MTIHYRMAGLDDAAMLADLGRRSFVDTFGHLYDPADLARFLEKHRQEQWRSELADPAFAVRIAEADGEPAAYAKLGPLSFPIEPEGDPIELRQFYVLKPWHGTSVSRDLMDWVLEESRRRAADELYLSVFIENHRARRFYERYGFRFVRTYAFMVGSQADEDHILRLDLKER